MACLVKKKMCAILLYPGREKGKINVAFKEGERTGPFYLLKGGEGGERCCFLGS